MKLKHLLLLLMTVVSFSTARAADDTTVVPADWTKVAFNPDFRYSQWVINSRLGDFYGNSTQVGFTQYDGNGNIVGSAKTSKFDYVPGLVAKATLEARDLYKDFDWSKPWFYTVLNYGKDYTYKGIRESKGVSLDNMNAAKMYFGLVSDALGTNAQTLVDGEIDAVITDMKDYNKNYVIGVTSFTNELSDAEGGWFHKPGYVGQMWCDGLYMGPALLAQIINYKNGGTNPHIVTEATGSENDWDLITKQFSISWKYVYNPDNNLLYHAFTANRSIAEKMCWDGVTANGTTYHSAAHWGRACGWYFLALVDVLEQMQKAKISSTDANYTELKKYVNLLAEGLASCQDDSGCWYQVLDQKANALAGNYLESSCTAIFTAAYLKGMRLGLFDKDYTAIAEKAYEGFVNNFMMRDANGNAQLIHCCASAGLGKECVADKLASFDVNSYKTSDLRSGSRDYYINGDTKKDVTQRNTYTEGKVLGAFILAATEYERLHTEKPVLLTLDLQPEHNLDGKTALEVAVSGDGTVTYQWYKDNALISGAKEAKYIPTATGTYYCLITVTPASSSAKGRATQNSDGTYTIKSQETNVTVTAETEDVIYDYTVKISEATNNIKYTATGGTATLGYGNKVDDKGFKSDGDLGTAKYICAELTGTLKAGDVIGIKAMATSSNGGIYIATSNTTTTDYVNAGTLSTKNAAETLTYTVKADDKLVGKSALYLYRNGVSTYIQQITVTRKDGPTTYTVTTSATNGTITVKDGNGNAVADLTEVEHGTKLVFTATPSSGYEFKSWTVDGTTVTDNPYTIESLSKATSVAANFTATSSSGGGETTTGEVIHFTDGSSSNDKVVTVVTGNCATNQGTVTYKGTSYTTCVKMESSTNITLKLAVESNVTFVFKEASSKFNINGTSYTTGSGGTCTIKLSAGDYTITKGATMNLFAIDVQPTGPSISITTQPQSSSYTVGETTVNPLTIEASVVSGTGYTLAYQWYKNTTKTNTGGELISDATSASYTPTLRETVGTDYYYCVVTATKESATTLTVTSDVAAVAVLNKSDIAYTTACGGNSNTWTPAAVGTTIDLSKLLTSSSTGAYTITSGNEFATLSADGKTLTAKKTGGTVTITQAADGEYASGSKELNIAIGSNDAKDGTNTYTVKKDEVYSDGLTVTREDITMTLGNDGFWAKGTAYTAGQNIPKPDSGNIPTSGTYYKFRPTKNGTLAVNVYIGKTDDGNLRPLYVSENGTAIEAKAGELTVGKGETPVAPAVGYYQGEVTFNVKANTDYYVYVNGSKMRFYGFTFIPSTETPVEGNVIATFENPAKPTWECKENNGVKITDIANLADGNSAAKIEPGGEITMTIPKGVTVTKIIVNVASNGSNSPVLTVNGIDNTISSKSYTDKTYDFSSIPIMGETTVSFKHSGTKDNLQIKQVLVYGEDKTTESNSNATFKYESSDLTFTKVEGAENTYEATIEVGAEKKNTNLGINVSTAAGATVVCDNEGTVSDDKATVTVKAPASIDPPATYTVTVTSADGTSATTYKITVKLKKQTIVLKYVLNDNSEDATEERKANAEWFWDKLANPSKEFTANTLVLHAYIADSKGNATAEELTSLPSGITYESDMPSVATVDKDNGTITPVGNSLGRAYIYATLENAEYEAKETRCAVYIRDGYTYNVTDADKKATPALNEFRYITDKDGKNLLRMKFGGWKYNGGKYIKPSVCQGSNWTSASDKDYVTDSWGKLADSGVNGIDGFSKGFPGTNDACDESMKPSTHYNSTRHGWFKAPSDDKNNLHDPNNITETSPFTLPVRGAYMTFEPMVNGTMSVFIIQNGAWNTYSSDDKEGTYKKGDIIPGEFRPHSFQVVNQRGLTLSQFATKWSVDTKQKVTDKYYCDPDDDTHSSEGILSPNVADWPEFNDGRLTDGERADIVEAWKGGPRGNQKIVMLHDGSFLAVEKGIVKYTFHVTGHETYYFFSNFSKMGFCGANFTPDKEANTQPTATLELDDEVAYPRFDTSESTGTYEGNPEMKRYNVTTQAFEELPKINKHTFTVTKADGQTIDGVNVEGAQAPQFKEIVMNRTFKKGQWNTLCVPFNMTQRKVEEIFGVGTQLILLETAKIQGNVVKLHFLYHEIQNVLPGYPYLIKPTLKYKKGGLYENDSYSDDAAYTSEPGVRTVDENTGDLTQFVVPIKHINPVITQQNIVCGDYSTTGTPDYCTADKEINVGGTIHKVSVVYGDGDVFLSDGDGKLYVSTGASYGKGYRAYIKKISPAQVKSISMEYSGVEDGGESTPTEIKFTELAPEAAMTLGFRGVYNLSGQKVAETTEGLPVGIYIVNGQKMVVR